MKTIEIIPSSLIGEINIPPSKSLCHRAVISAALANGRSIIKNVELSEDITATIQGVQALGAVVSYEDNCLTVDGGLKSELEKVEIECRESGSTLRFLMPIGLLKDTSIFYKGRGNLCNRPLGSYLDIFMEQGIYYSSPTLPMEVMGKLKPGMFKLQGNISSQFITGLMFVLPLLESDSEIVILDKLESKSYIDLTIDVLKSFNIHIQQVDNQRFYIKGGQQYKPTEYTVDSDFSQAAFWIAAGVLNGNISCKGLNPESKQGDRKFIDILKAAGAQISVSDDTIISASSSLNAFHADVSQCPDIAPILTVVAAFSRGTSSITGAARLRIKECDRLSAIAQELSKLGAEVSEAADSLTIKGSERLKGGVVDSWGDHRIAMALSVAALRCDEPVIIKNSDVIKKSYPGFYKDFAMLGGNLHERNLG